MNCRRESSEKLLNQLTIISALFSVIAHTLERCVVET